MQDYPYLSLAIGKSIEFFRKNKKMTKTALAEFSLLERRYLREIENGEKRPTVNAIYFICAALKITPCEFFSHVEEERKNLKQKDAGKIHF